MIPLPTSNEQRGPSAGLVCVLCGFPKENHRPESEAHHSECTLEQFAAAEKIPYVKMTRAEYDAMPEFEGW